MVFSHSPHEPASGGSIRLGVYGLAARLTPEVSRSPMTITTSIPATSAASPQPDVLGASHTLGMGVGGASATDAGALAFVPHDPASGGSIA